MRKGRIALIIPGIPQSSGGPSIAVAALAGCLAKAGHEVTIATADLMPNGGCPGPMIEVDSQVKVHLFGVRSRWDRRLYRSAVMRQWLHGAIGEFDVVDIQGVWSFVTVNAARACLRARVPYVLTPHGQMARWDWTKHPWQKRAFFGAFLSRAWNSAAAIRFVSEGEVRHSMRDPGHRGLIIPYPVAMPVEGTLRHLGGRFRDEVGIAQDAPVILFLGRVTAQKGVLELLEAFDLLWQRRQDAILVLIGPPDGEYGTAVAERIGHLPSRPNIHLLGPAYGERKYSALAAASLFVTLSQNEGLPNAVLEAMAWGLPVVITAQANLPEVAAYNAGVVVAANPESVADALNRLLGDPAQLKQIGRNARRLVEERFTWEKVLPQMLALYERIAHNRR